MRAWWLLVVVACSSPARPHAPVDLGTAGAPGLQALDPAALEATTKLLASDELEGRGTGTPGGAKAEGIVADRFAALGLAPAGENGTFFQTIHFREGTRDDAASSFVVHGTGGDITFEHGQVFLRPDLSDPKRSIDAPMRFVGYGISRPELGYDDLAGVDVKGAIVVVMGGAPREISGKPVGAALHAVLADIPNRTLELKARGALAVIGIYDPARAARMPFELYLTKLLGPALAYLEQGVPASLPALPYAAIDEAGFDRVLASIPGAPKAHAIWERIDKGEHVTMALPAASLRLHSSHRDVVARNVVAMIRGETDEVVVYSAHLDHLGIGPAVDGDTIYNGAMDNAIGVAGTIEIARAFKAMPAKPRRSILFVAVTGEEKGLLGSDYFTKHPTVPAGKIVANINIDGLTPDHPVRDILALGSEHSTLDAAVRDAARVVGLVVATDPDPDQVYFIRSDQYSFVKIGVPSIFPGAGWLDDKGDPNGWKAQSDAWGDAHYHRPSDQWMPSMRAEWALSELRFAFLVGLSVVNSVERPRWNDGDVFGTFAKRR